MPSSYKKWWMRKFEFTMRHAVHVHEISKRVFVFPRHESIMKLLSSQTSLNQLTREDFVEVEFRGDRLASCERAVSVLSVGAEVLESKSDSQVSYNR